MFTYFKRVYQEWMIDQYCKAETQRMRWFRTHQEELRAEVYHGLADAVNSADHSAARVGWRIILPGSFTAGPRFMVQRYQDAMAIVRKFGKPDLFLTYTCNPKSPEILAKLRPGEEPNDRPDLIARVFHIKLDRMLKEMTAGQIFGRVQGAIHVIEFQKR